jgi:hypothetical protein
MLSADSFLLPSPKGYANKPVHHAKALEAGKEDLFQYWYRGTGADSDLAVVIAVGEVPRMTFKLRLDGKELTGKVLIATDAPREGWPAEAERPIRAKPIACPR